MGKLKIVDGVLKLEVQGGAEHLYCLVLSKILKGKAELIDSELHFLPDGARRPFAIKAKDIRLLSEMTSRLADLAEKEELKT